MFAGDHGEAAAMGEVGGNFFDGSMRAIEQQSARSTEEVINNVEDLLYAVSDNEEEEEEGEEEGGAAEEPMEVEGGYDGYGGMDMDTVPRFDYDRHCGVGYNAHHDGVDADEVTDAFM
jgi:hypothetical protein